MTNRRGFLGSLAATAAAGLAVVAPSLGAELFTSHDGVPRHLDVRTDDSAGGAPIKVFRHGVEVRYCVAYDLDAQTVTRYRQTPSGEIAIAGNECSYVTEYGGVTVEWKPDA